MKKLIITVGPSASGKSHIYHTLSKKELEHSGELNRDSLRAEYQQTVQNLDIPLTQNRPIWDKWKWKNEPLITEMFNERFKLLLQDGTVRTIYWTDTNLNYDRLMNKISEFKSLAKEKNIELDVNIRLMYESEDILIKRDNARSNGVGSSVIHKQVKDFHNFLAVCDMGIVPRELQELAFFLRTPKNEDLEDVIIVDLDGTIASMDGKRGPFEWNKVYNDSVIEEHEKIIESYLKDNNINKIIFLTGRDAEAYVESFKWLKHKSLLSQFDFELYSRAHKDTRKDYIIKQELFLEHIAGKYNVRAVFDDRPQVCRMWWHLGLKVYQMQNPYLEF